MGISSVAYTFFIKDHLSLSVSELATIGIWATLPWSLKILFGYFIDKVPIFGNNRKSYIILGAVLVSLGTGAIVDLTGMHILADKLGEYNTLLASHVLTQIGLVFQDLTADTMAVEVVEDGPKRDYELGMVQVLSRLSFQVGALLAAFLTGWLATSFSFSTVFSLRFIIPIISITPLLFLTANAVSDGKDTANAVTHDKPLIIKVLIFTAFILGLILFGGAYKQILLLLVSMAFIAWFFKDLLVEMKPDNRTIFLRASLGIFLFRCVPYIGEGVQWWLVNSIGLTEYDFGVLRQISFIMSLGVVWILADRVAGSSIKIVLISLAGLDIIFQLPEIGIFYGLHEYLGVSAKSLVYVTTAMTSPIGPLSMIPLGILIAKYAPAAKRAMYFAVTASLMNVALQAGSLITKHLNEIFLVTRQDFSNLGQIMISVLLLSIVFPTLGALIIREENNGTN